ncbi:MAG: helix-turn-helix transcriptional regulator [Micrococcales bacterium]|nr:helix-turn-helix transcriptional regulator [Micrococcales bacterium]MCL2666415.1 helix-turn-helix transcriptional regulator [Micrococcales bacterium]
MTTIGERVREARQEKNLTQTDLAGDTLSPSYVSLIESGRRTPTDKALAVIAAHLGTTLEYLKYGDDGPNESRVRLELDYARLSLADGDPESAERRIHSLDLDVVTSQLRYEALYVKAQAAEMAGDIESSIGILEPLYADRESVGDFLELAKVATSLVVSYLESGDLIRSVDIGERALTALEGAGLAGSDEHLRLGSALLWSYVERGDLLYATQQASELIRVAEILGSPRGRGSVYWNAAVVVGERRDYERAKQHTQRALALMGEGDADRDVSRLRVHYAWLLLRSDPPQPEAALAQLDRAEGPLTLLGSAGDRAAIETERARARMLLGDSVAAVDHARVALALLGDQPRLEAANTLVVLGDALVTQHQVEAAAEVYERAANMLGMMSATRQSAQVWRDLGDRYLFRGESARAALAFEHALREAGVRSTIPTEAMLGNPLHENLSMKDLRTER